MRKKILLAAIVVSFLVLGYASLRPSEARAQAGGKNLKVLPKTMTKPELKKYMKTVVAEGLGVQCDFCHNTDDMALDTPKKERAREMMTMVSETNKKYFKGKDRVKCVMCHAGKAEPK